MTIRKNFLFDEEVAKHLEEIAKVEGKTQTQVIQELTEQRYRQLRKQKRLEALEKLAGSVPPGSLVDVDIKEARVKKAIKRAK